MAMTTLNSSHDDAEDIYVSQKEGQAEPFTSAAPIATEAQAQAQAYADRATTGMDDAQGYYDRLPDDGQCRLWDAMRHRIAWRDGEAAMAYQIRPTIGAKLEAFLDEAGAGLAVVQPSHSLATHRKPHLWDRRKACY